MAETKLIYDSPRPINIGDVFYVLSRREYKNFYAPCRVCNDTKKVTVNGVTFNCPMCCGYSSRTDETMISINHYTVMAVKVYDVRQTMSTDTWKGSDPRGIDFAVYRKRGFGYTGDPDNFTRRFTSSAVKQCLNQLPECRDYYT